MAGKDPRTAADLFRRLRWLLEQFRAWIRGGVLLSPEQQKTMRERQAELDMQVCESWKSRPDDVRRDGSRGKDRIGICCSGGGIRSAAFNLGALQALQDKGVLGKARYLAAVSGGSYIAAAMFIVQKQFQGPGTVEAPEKEPQAPNALSRVAQEVRKQRPEWAARSARFFEGPQQGQQLDPDAKFRGDRGNRPYDPGSPEERWLRSNSSYLAPDWLGKLQLASYALFGALLIMVVVGSLLLITGGIAGMVGAAFQPALGPGGAGATASPWLDGVQWAAGALAAVGLLLELVGVGTRLGDGGGSLVRRWGRRSLILAALLFLLSTGLPWLVLLLRGLADALTSGGTEADALTEILGVLGAAGVPALLLAVVRVLTRQLQTVDSKETLRWLSRIPSWPMLVAGLVGPLILVAGFLLAYNFVAVRSVRSGALIVLATSILVYLFSKAFDPTTASMHTYYKRRLASAFAVQRVRRPGASEVIALPRPFHRLTKLSASKIDDWPQLLVCAAANISDPGATPTGRNAMPFVFSHDWVGGKDIGWIRTEDFEKALGTTRRRDATLLAAVAMSGAAISPSMGKMSKPALRFLLALANARLGVWLPNPRYVEAPGEDAASGAQAPIHPRRRPRMSWLLREMAGWNSLNAKYVYVTDGGHFENLGLLELLRRGCTQIYCFDASGDPPESFATLAQTLALARTELDIDIPIDPAKLRPPSENGAAGNGRALARRSHIVVPFRYRHAGRDTRGTLVYVKCRVTKNAPWDVRALHERDKAFPDHSTADQLYGEERFEAYRALGSHLAKVALDEMRVERRRPTGPATRSGATSVAPPDIGLQGPSKAVAHATRRR